METEASIKEPQSIFANEMSQEKIINGGEHLTAGKYRMFTEDEIIQLRGGMTHWSDRMKEESNFLYKLKYSQGIITPSFIEGVVESLEASEDFEITSFGHSKFILFIAGNQPLVKEDIDPKIPFYLPTPDVSEHALKRLEHRNFLVLNSGGYSYFPSRSGNQWVISQITFPVTLKPDLIFWFRTWEERKIKKLKERSYA